MTLWGIICVTALQAGKSPFKSLAEKVREFQCKTPLRFRSKTEQAAPVQHLQQQLQITDAKVWMTGHEVQAYLRVLHW